MNSVTFKHLLTGKDFVVFQPHKTVLGLLSGPVQGREGPDRTWVILSGAPAPIPVEETHEEVLTKINQTINKLGETNE